RVLAGRSSRSGVHTKEASWNVRFSPPSSADFLASPRSAAWLLSAQRQVLLPLNHLVPRANGGSSIPSLTKTSPYSQSSVPLVKTPVRSSLSKKDSRPARSLSPSRGHKSCSARATDAPSTFNRPPPALPLTSLSSPIAVSVR